MLRVVGIAILVFSGFLQTAAAEQPSIPLSVEDLARRLEVTERRLLDTESQLQTLRQNQPSTDSSGPMTHLPSSESDHRQVAFSFLEDCDLAMACDGYCGDCGQSVCQGVPHICSCCSEKLSWNKAGGWRITPFGKLEAETVFATDTAVSENYIVFAAPRGATETERFDINGQSSQVGLNIAGPRLGAFEVGGLVLFDFHGNRPSRNEPGVYFIRAYAELVNDNWRIAFGQMGDTIGGWNAETVNWPGIGGLGFLGANQRGTFRIDRYLNPSEHVQWTITGALTQPVVTDLAGFQDALGQDNGIPNIETQIVLGLGDDDGGERPLQFSLSGMYNEFFSGANNLPNLPPTVTNTSRGYAVAGAMQWKGERMGYRGQVWHGAGLGTYMGGISQSLNPETGDTIRSTGGFGQLWFQVLPRVRMSVLAGIDDPRNGDLSTIPGDNQRERNQLIGGNMFINITDYFHIGMDVWGVQTDYVDPGNDNDIVVVMSEATITF